MTGTSALAMPMTADDWVGAVAQKAKVTPEQVQAVLDRYGILPQAALPRRRTLGVTSIRLAGTKRGTEADRPIDFHWGKPGEELGPGLWAVLSDDNFRGKSSLLNVVQAALRGEFPGFIKPDVWGWLSLVEVSFRIDVTAYRVRVEKDEGEKDPRLARATLSRRDGDEWFAVHAGAADEGFAKAVADNMLEEFGFTLFHAYNKLQGPRTHGWNAIAASFFVNGPGKAVFGEVTRDGVPLRLLQMFMGLPWVSTYSAASTALKKVEAERVRSPAADPGRERLAARLAAAEEELRAARARVGAAVDRPRLRLDLLSGDRELVGFQAAVEEARARVADLDRQVAGATGSVAGLKRTEQQVRDEQAAGLVFRQLRPVCCPSCDNGIDTGRYEAAEGRGSCALCGERHHEADDDGSRLADLWADIEEADQSLLRLRAELAAAQGRQRRNEESRDAAKARIADITMALASAEEADAELRVRGLEAQVAQLAEIIAEQAAPTGPTVSDDGEILKQVEKVTRDLYDGLQRDVLKEVSEVLTGLCRDFGLKNVERMEWATNNVLTIWQGASEATFSDLAPGERLRVRIAAALAVIEVARRRHFGRHPGFLVLDSPAAQEMSADNFAVLMASVREAVRRTDDVQVIVGAVTRPELLGVVEGAWRLQPGDDRFLF